MAEAKPNNTPVEKKKRNSRKKANAPEPKLEATLWAAADKLRGHMDAAGYKHGVLDLWSAAACRRFSITVLRVDSITKRWQATALQRRFAFDKQRLSAPVDLIAKIGLGDRENRSQDLLGRVYEYFLGQFASTEGKKGEQFYTARCVVQLLVEMLAPYKGRLFDPCCGSGGMFVQGEKFVEEHGCRIR